MNETIGHKIARGVALAGLIVAAVGCSRFEARMELKKGNTAYRKGDFADALGFYTNVPSDSPDRVRAALNSGYANMAQYRFGSKHPKDREFAAGAVEAFSEYLAIRPEDQQETAEYPGKSEIEERIITLLVDAERYQDAIERLEFQLEEQPDNAGLVRGLASTYEKWGKPTMAIVYFDRWAEMSAADDASRHASIAMYTWNKSFRENSMMTPLERNRWIDRGVDAAERVIRIDPESFEGNLYKNLLLIERTKIRIDPDEIAALRFEAKLLQNKAQEINDKRKAERERREAEKQKEAGTAEHQDTPASEES